MFAGGELMFLGTAPGSQEKRKENGDFSEMNHLVRAWILQEREAWPSLDEHLEPYWPSHLMF